MFHFRTTLVLDLSLDTETTKGLYLCLQITLTIQKFRFLYILGKCKKTFFKTIHKYFLALTLILSESIFTYKNSCFVSIMQL